MFFKNKVIAFTIAEIIVTIGIIGVVASMTIPSIISKYKHKVLETQFKKSISTAQTIINLAKSETGIDRFAKSCAVFDTNAEKYHLLDSCTDALAKQILQTYKKNKSSGVWGNKYDIVRTDEIRTYNNLKKSTSTHSAGISYPIFYTRALGDGSYLNFWIIESKMYVGIDVNGAQKPNQLGHDVFIFVVNKEKDTLTDTTVAHGKPTNYTDDEREQTTAHLENSYSANRYGNPCFTNSTSPSNGIGCSYFALRDECPNNPRQKYFECLP